MGGCCCAPLKRDARYNKLQDETILKKELVQGVSLVTVIDDESTKGAWNRMQLIRKSMSNIELFPEEGRTFFNKAMEIVSEFLATTDGDLYVYYMLLFANKVLFLYIDKGRGNGNNLTWDELEVKGPWLSKVREVKTAIAAKSLYFERKGIPSIFFSSILSEMELGLQSLQPCKKPAEAIHNIGCSCLDMAASGAKCFATGGATTPEVVGKVLRGVCVVAEVSWTFYQQNLYSQISKLKRYESEVSRHKFSVREVEEKSREYEKNVYHEQTPEALSAYANYLSELVLACIIDGSGRFTKERRGSGRSEDSSLELAFRLIDGDSVEGQKEYCFLGLKGLAEFASEESLDKSLDECRAEKPILLKITAKTVFEWLDKKYFCASEFVPLVQNLIATAYESGHAMAFEKLRHLHTTILEDTITAMLDVFLPHSQIKQEYSWWKAARVFECCGRNRVEPDTQADSKGNETERDYYFASDVKLMIKNLIESFLNGIYDFYPEKLGTSDLEAEPRQSTSLGAATGHSSNVFDNKDSESEAFVNIVFRPFLSAAIGYEDTCVLDPKLDHHEMNIQISAILASKIRLHDSKSENKRNNNLNIREDAKDDDVQAFDKVLHNIFTSEDENVTKHAEHLKRVLQDLTRSARDQNTKLEKIIGKLMTFSTHFHDISTKLMYIAEEMKYFSNSSERKDVAVIFLERFVEISYVLQSDLSLLDTLLMDGQKKQEQFANWLGAEAIDSNPKDSYPNPFQHVENFLSFSMSFAGKVACYLWRLKSSSDLLCQHNEPQKLDIDYYWMYGKIEENQPVFECKTRGQPTKKLARMDESGKKKGYSEISLVSIRCVLNNLKEKEERLAHFKEKINSEFDKSKDYLYVFAADADTVEKGQELAEMVNEKEFPDIPDLESLHLDGLGIDEQLGSCLLDNSDGLSNVCFTWRIADIFTKTFWRKKWWSVRYISILFLLQIKHLLCQALSATPENYSSKMKISERKQHVKLLTAVCMILETRNLKEKDPRARLAFNTERFVSEILRFRQGDWKSSEKEQEEDDVKMSEIFDKILKETDKNRRQRLCVQLKKLENSRPNVNIADLRHEINNHFLRSMILTKQEQTSVVSDITKKVRNEVIEAFQRQIEALREHNISLQSVQNPESLDNLKKVLECHQMHINIHFQMQNAISAHRHEHDQSQTKHLIDMQVKVKKIKNSLRVTMFSYKPVDLQESVKNSHSKYMKSRTLPTKANLLSKLKYYRENSGENSGVNLPSRSLYDHLKKFIDDPGAKNLAALVVTQPSGVRRTRFREYFETLARSLCLGRLDTDCCASSPAVGAAPSTIEKPNTVSQPVLFLKVKLHLLHCPFSNLFDEAIQKELDLNSRQMATLWSDLEQGKESCKFILFLEGFEKIRNLKIQENAFAKNSMGRLLTSGRSNIFIVYAGLLEDFPYVCPLVKDQSFDTVSPHFQLAPYEESEIQEYVITRVAIDFRLAFEKEFGVFDPHSDRYNLVLISLKGQLEGLDKGDHSYQYVKRLLESLDLKDIGRAKYELSTSDVCGQHAVEAAAKTADLNSRGNSTTNLLKKLFVVLNCIKDMKCKIDLKELLDNPELSLAKIGDSDSFVARQVNSILTHEDFVSRRDQMAEDDYKFYSENFFELFFEVILYMGKSGPESAGSKDHFQNGPNQYRFYVMCAKKLVERKAAKQWICLNEDVARMTVGYQQIATDAWTCMQKLACIMKQQHTLSFHCTSASIFLSKLDHEQWQHSSHGNIRQASRVYKAPDYAKRLIQEVLPVVQVEGIATGKACDLFRFSDDRLLDVLVVDTLREELLYCRSTHCVSLESIDMSTQEMSAEVQLKTNFTQKVKGSIHSLVGLIRSISLSSWNSIDLWYEIESKSKFSTFLIESMIDDAKFAETVAIAYVVSKASWLQTHLFQQVDIVGMKRLLKAFYESKVVMDQQEKFVKDLMPIILEELGESDISFIVQPGSGESVWVRNINFRGKQAEVQSEDSSSSVASVCREFKMMPEDVKALQESNHCLQLNQVSSQLSSLQEYLSSEVKVSLHELRAKQRVLEELVTEMNDRQTVSLASLEQKLQEQQIHAQNHASSVEQLNELQTPLTSNGQVNDCDQPGLQLDSNQSLKEEIFRIYDAIKALKRIRIEIAAEELNPRERQCMIVTGHEEAQALELFLCSLKESGFASELASLKESLSAVRDLRGSCEAVLESLRLGLNSLSESVMGMAELDASLRSLISEIEPAGARMRAQAHAMVEQSRAAAAIGDALGMVTTEVDITEIRQVSGSLAACLDGARKLERMLEGLPGAAARAGEMGTSQEVARLNDGLARIGSLLGRAASFRDNVHRLEQTLQTNLRTDLRTLISQNKVWLKLVRSPYHTWFPNAVLRLPSEAEVGGDGGHDNDSCDGSGKSFTDSEVNSGGQDILDGQASHWPAGSAAADPSGPVSLKTTSVSLGSATSHEVEPMPPAMDQAPDSSPLPVVEDGLEPVGHGASSAAPSTDLLPWDEPVK